MSMNNKRSGHMEQKQQVSHIVILPFPLPGHVKPMLHLAELLSQSGLHITFVNSDYNHHRLQSVTDITAFCNRFPTFHFDKISDGLPPEYPRIGLSTLEIFFSTRRVTKSLFQELLVKLIRKRPPPTCVIVDSIMCSAIDAAKDLGISVFTFCTSSPCGMWANMHTSKLLEAAEIPVQDEKDMDKPITCIPGMDDGLLRLRDLPGHCRLELEDPIMEFNISQTTAMTRASALIFNTFQELNKPIISPLKSFFPKIYSIGPLHALFKSLIKDFSLSLSSNGAALRKEDKSCMTWLDQQSLRSVIYVSFGSLIGLSRTQLLEFWYGLVNSGKPFLWVIKMDSVDEGLAQILSGLEEETKKRGYIVGWAPQEDVLAHPAIGGFLTHGGWNSTLESIYAGIPMICWPMFADQQVNSRCVSDLWRIGFDMKDTCDRVIIEKMVRDLMDEKREEIMKSTAEIANMARTSVENGGSSYHNLEMLIDDLTSMVSSS